MFGGGGAGGRHAAAPRPQLRVCYLCGQQFGSASIGIHVPQCYAKKVAQWEIGNPATRGTKPKHPDTVNWKGGGQSVKKLNDDQFKEFESNLVPCPNCARTFLPDRLPVHLRGCKSSSTTSRPGTKSGGSGGAASEFGGSSVSSPGVKVRRAASTRRAPGTRLVLPTCYLCGQQFGNASIDIHIPQCYSKKMAQWQSADPAIRGNPPKHPDEVKAKLSAAGVGGAASAQEQTDAQFQEFVNNLEPCPNCARRFLPDRLVVHLRSCRPGNAAKRPPPRGGGGAAEGGGEASQPEHTPAPPPKAARGAASRSPRPVASAGAAADTTEDSPDTEVLAARLEELERLNPKTNRVPKNSSIKTAGGRTCPQCEAVEYDTEAKYCRGCGWNLCSRTLPDPCSRCGEAVPEGSRFCGTCGAPVDGAAASERAEGGENINAPTVRIGPCPACRAVCDVDGNFCDNCGAVLGGEETPEGGSGGASGAMYCPHCKETQPDPSAVYCEDCGGKLEALLEGGGTGTLRPDRAPSLTPSAAAASTGSRSEAGERRGAAPPRQQRSVPKKSATPPPAQPEWSNAGVNESAFPGEEPPAEEDRVECATCGRRFAPQALERHSRLCAKQQQKSRPVFNMTKQRLADCDVPPSASSAQRPVSRRVPGNSNASARSAGAAASGALAPPKKNWRAESEAFRAAMRGARQVDKVLKSGGDARNLPPPTYSENAHYVPCPHCQRRFAPDVAERHIPRCATTVNRPKPPPRRR